MSASRFLLPILCASVLPLSAADPSPGSVLLASADGLSVFDRAGAMSFGRFFVPMNEGKPGAAEWSDMIYDGCKLASGNYLCSSHHWVRELSPEGKVLWEYRVQAPVELKTCVPLPDCVHPVHPAFTCQPPA